MKPLRLMTAALAASLTLVSLSAFAQAPEKPKKPGKGRPAAMGKVEKLDTAAKTFTVTSKKKGEVLVSWDDKTAFKKRGTATGEKPTDGTAADLKAGDYASVTGKVEGAKIQATQVIFGARIKKAKTK